MNTPSFKRLATRFGLAAGPLAALLLWAALPDAYARPDGTVVPFSSAGKATAALAAWMALWWMTEAIPVYATALMPLAFLPLWGAGTMAEAATPYGNPLLFLFLGGFLLAFSMERWRLDHRIAYTAALFFGLKAERLVLGFMGVAAVLSMWISNTAATMALYPVALSLLTVARAHLDAETGDRLGKALLLGIAYAASIGGLGTLIGTPPNLVLASFVRQELGVEIGFGQWMLLGLPLVALLLPLAWMLLVRVFPVRGVTIPEMRALAREALDRLGPLQRGEVATAAVFTAAVLGWVGRPLWAKLSVAGVKPLAGLTDTGIAVLAALALFVLPARRKPYVPVLDWETASRLPYGILLLFGGGLSLADAIARNGVGEFLGSFTTHFGAWPALAFVAAVCVGTLMLSEMTSNTATAATFIPLLAAAAAGAGWDPLHLAVPAALAASCAFTLPVATPPNAIVYASGQVGMGAMLRAGLRLDAIAIVVITLAAAYWAPWVLDR